MTISYKQLLLTLAAAAALMLTGCGGGGSSDNASGGESTAEYVPFDAPPIDEATKQAYLNAVNAARAVGHTCGEYGYFPPAPPVQWDNAVYRAAYEHSYDMAMSDFFEHDGSGTENDWTAQVLNLGRGSMTEERLRNNRATFEFALENIAGGNGKASTVSGTIELWLNSPGHCSALMYKDGTRIGLAHVSNPNSTYGNYWTLNMI